MVVFLLTFNDFLAPTAAAQNGNNNPNTPPEKITAPGAPRAANPAPQLHRWTLAMGSAGR